MSSNLIQIKAFLGKYYPELAYSSIQDKYAKVNLDLFFEQRYYIQNNKTQMLVDPNLNGLIAIVSGNEIHISKDLYDHPNVEVTNSMENQETNISNPKSLYNPEVFPTIAYLICQNHTMFRIIGEIDEPIYIKYKSDYESFHNSVVVFELVDGVNVEIVEEFESHCAVNAVTNYILHTDAQLHLSSFYQNIMSATSFCLRNVIVRDGAKYNHILFGKGSANVIDENKINIYNRGSVRLLGCINPGQQEFHTIVGVQPSATDYSFFLDHRHIVSGTGKVTFTPLIVGHLPPDSHVTISSLPLDAIQAEDRNTKISEFLSPIVEQATLERITGATRFYKNKSKFLQFQ